MDAQIKYPSILRLTGITLSDYVPPENKADDKFTEDICDELIIDETYDKIPPTFTNLENWPRSTNLHCWQCNRTFDNPPVFEPTYFREITSTTIEIGTSGNMCSFPCVARHIINKYSENERRIKLNLLCTLFYYFRGFRVANIKPAPDKTELQQYGGLMSFHDYEKKIASLEPVPPRQMASTIQQPKKQTMWDMFYNNNLMAVTNTDITTVEPTTEVASAIADIASAAELTASDDIFDDLIDDF